VRHAFDRRSIPFLMFAATIGLGPIARSAEPGATAGPRQAVEPATPQLPAEIVAAMQEGRYADADKALSALANRPETSAEMKGYVAVIRGVALRLSGRLDAAREILTADLKSAPGGRWAPKARSELAAVEVAAGRFAAAEALARDEAERLLAGDRKDRLAEVYRGFADRLLSPDQPTIPADPEGAFALLAQARSLAKGETLRASLLLAMARASQKAGNHARAIADFQVYLGEYTRGADRTAVRYGLGESQLAAGEALPARLTWTDLARDLEKVDTREAADTRARALYGIARTHGIPGPPDDTQMNLGVAALKRLLSSFPSHPLAARTAYEIGSSYLARGKSQEALAAFEAFIKRDEPGGNDEARRERAELLMSAQFLVGRILQGQGKFDEAIAAYKGYLAKYPDGPQSADAQRAVLDAQVQIAQDLLRREKYAEARAASLAFAVQNPLDGRVPQLLFEVGQTHSIEKKYDEAVAAWETLAGKFPGTEPAGHAQFAIAATYENEKGDPAAAIERYRKVAVEPWRSQAAQRIALMEAKSLSVVTERAFRSGETPRLKIATRNLEKLTFTAYKIDPETYFRKKHTLSGVEALDIGLVAPDAEWTSEVPRYGRYRPIETTYELKKLEMPGVYVVKVSDEKTLQATTLVLGSDVDAIVKISREQILVFAQDMKTGKGRPGARVLVSDDEGVIVDARTGKDGVLVRDWDKPMEPGQGANAAPKAEPVPIPQPAPAQAPTPPPAPCGPAPEVLTPGAEPAAVAEMAAPDAPPAAVHPRAPRGAISYLVLDGGDVAGSGLSVPEKVAQGLSARAYLYTDRPAYRPGHDVELRGVVREVVDGQYANVPGATYSLEVYDSRGRKLVNRPLKLSDFGTFHETISLDEGAPVGSYRIRLWQPGKSEFAGAFEVQAYQLEKIDLAFDLPRTVYYRGETVKGSLVARYQYGTPLANRAIALQLPDGRTLQGRTDAAGQYAFELETTGFSEEQALRLVAQLPQDNVAAAAAVMLAVRAFRIDLGTTRDVYLDGETFSFRATTLDAQGEPTGQALSVAVLKRVERKGQVSEREASRQELVTDKKTGKGEIRLKVDDDEGGSYVVRAAGTDRFGNPVLAERLLTISGKKDETKLRILTDRTTFKVGESAEVRLVNRGRAGTALLTWEADRILSYRIVPIKEGDNALAWEVEGPQFPNFTLAASRMAPSAFHQARLDVRVERDLRVTLTSKAPSVGPGGEVEVEVGTTDQNGKPVAAELSIALVDRSLLRLFGDRLPTIDRFFYDQSRTSAFATESSATFRYQPATVPVPEAVVEDAAQQAAQFADALKRDETKKQARNFGYLSPQEATPMAPAASAPVMARMGQAVGRRAPQGRPGVDQALSGRAASTKDSEADFAAKAGDNTAGYFEQGEGVASDEKSLGLRGELNNSRRRRGGRWGKDVGEDRAAPRERFVETAYWNPSVVTGKDGKAVVKFRAPAALSEYRFTARGVSGRDTLVGQATADLAVRKDFFVDLKVPPAVTQGDKPRFSAEVHHRGVVGTLTLRLATYAGGRESVEPKRIEVKADGVEEILFDPFDVPDGDEVRLTLAATLGESKDEMTVAVPIRPWGVQAFASASGSATDDTTAFVALPPGRRYEQPEMLVVISPTVRRMLIELAMGEDAYRIEGRSWSCIPVPPSTTADRAGDLLAAGAATAYLQSTRATGTPEALRLTDRVRGLVSELVSLQNEDGGWPWAAGTKGQPRPSDRMTSACVFWSLTTAESLGLMTDAAVLDKAVTWLAQELARVEGGDNETRATLLHALSTRKKATFEQANALNRVRQGLSNASLAYLALTFANLDRASLGEEVLGVLAPRGKTEPTVPGGKARRYWSGAGQHPWHRSDAETTALAALAFAQVRPDAPDLAAACDWLLAHRQGTGWQPPKAKGPALAALAKFHGSARAAEDRYRLIVTVNDQEVYRADVVGATEGKAIRVPNRFVQAAANNRVKFDIEGRGQFGYAVTLTGFTREFGPDQDRANKPFGVHRRVYWADTPTLDGKPLSAGFTAAVHPQTFENTVTQAPLGGKVSISVEAWRDQPAGQPSWERDFLVLKEYLPAGTTLVEGSVNSQAGHYTVEDGVLTLYFAPDQHPGVVYEVYGYLPGAYRALPPSLFSAYEPGRRHLGEPGGLKVLAPGEKSTDPYRPTPDEEYARGKALFEAGRLAEATAHLKALWGGYALRDDVARDAARMLLTIAIKEYNPKDVVVYFEVLKEKDPDRVISFDDIKVVGRAYGDLGEHERAFLVWRATTEASYLEDARVGEVLRQRGKVLDGIAYLLDLWRDHPSTASIQSDFFGLAQVVAGLAGRATTDPAIRTELAGAGTTRSDLLLQAIRLDQAFLAQSPSNPLADEASLAIVGAFLDLEDFASVVRLSRRYAELYPRSTFQDSFQYSEALGRFHLGEYDRAIAVAEKIAAATYKDPNGVDQPSPNKWQALYILGQIHDARLEPAKALAYYRRVADRFSDAAGAVKSLTRKELKLPEISVIRPADPAVAAAGVGLRTVPVQDPGDRKGRKDETTGAKLDYRNIATADVKVYPVDLMRLYLTRRNLDAIAGIDLAGIKPFYSATIKLGDGQDFDDKARAIDFPVKREGAYLVMVRGDDRYASGILLVSPLELQVLEEAESGRVRVTVRDARTKALVPKVQVKVIGSGNGSFFSGETDLRGVFVAEGVRGQVTAVARKGSNQYAFHRGTTPIGPSPVVPNAPGQAGQNQPGQQGQNPPGQPAAGSFDLQQNVRGQNTSNQERQLQRLEERYKPQDNGVKAKSAY
jgi:uncharacterized protein YfaS (alpha-2-macroglobulin family)/tetratricopeptide (TPR) repeat protein